MYSALERDCKQARGPRHEVRHVTNSLLFATHWRTYLVYIFSEEIPAGYCRERIAYMPFVLISDGRRIIQAGLPLSLSSLCVAEEALFVLASKG